MSFYDQDVLTLAALQSKWALASKLAPLTPTDRLEELRALVMNSCAIESHLPHVSEKEQIHRADLEAKSLIELLFQAFMDVFFLPLVSHTNEFHRYLRDGTHREEQEGRRNASAMRADAALQIYNKMVDLKENPRFNWVHTDPRQKGYGFGYHPETRLLLLHEITREWSDTANDARSMEFFSFLMKIASMRGIHSDYLETISNVTREYNRRCSRERLEACMLSLEGKKLEEDGAKKIFDALRLGWVSHVTIPLVRLNNKLSGSPVAVWQYAQKATEQAISFHKEIDPLFLVRSYTPPAPAGPLCGWNLDNIHPPSRTIWASRKYTAHASKKAMDQDLQKALSDVKVWIGSRSGSVVVVHLSVLQMNYNETTIDFEWSDCT